jgi:hypothetical protein
MPLGTSSPSLLDLAITVTMSTAIILVILAVLLRAKSWGQVGWKDAFAWAVKETVRLFLVFGLGLSVIGTFFYTPLFAYAVLVPGKVDPSSTLVLLIVSALGLGFTWVFAPYYRLGHVALASLVTKKVSRPTECVDKHLVSLSAFFTLAFDLNIVSAVIWNASVVKETAIPLLAELVVIAVVAVMIYTAKNCTRVERLLSPPPPPKPKAQQS